MVNGYLRIGPEDVIYSALPLSSSYGLYQLLLGLAVGAAVVLDRGFSFPASSLALAARERATVLAAVPTMLGWMATTPLLENHDLSALRIVTSAAAALAPGHSLKLLERLPHARLYVMYGQTECKRISWLDPDDLPRHPDSVGKGLAGQQHRVITDSGTDAAAGELGELIVRGPHVMRGYWRKAQETTIKLRPAADGGLPWMHTGDAFKADADGFLYFAGRRDEMLMIGGHKVSPIEIEGVLCQIPGVLEAAVIGVADAHWGEVVTAHVVAATNSQLTEEDVKRYCSQRLRGFMVPRVVKFAAELPKTASGKILKRALPT
jgi:acyl-CoA synthetase (AMP-forming)/AMP-acid ligase II